MNRLFLLPLAVILLVRCAPVQSGPTAAGTTESLPWWREAVFYEIFVRSFYDTNGDGIGDLNGVTAKLDYLSEVGVNAIWLMPVNPSPSYHGYDVTDYYAINPQYGSMEDFKRLLAQAHKRGMHVIVDLVINHTSSRHPQFIDAVQKGTQSKYYEWYIWSDTNQGRYWHALPGNASRYYFGLFCDCMPDLNYHNPEVTAETEKISRFWLNDVGVDGFRLDAAKHLIEDGNVIQNTPETHDWLKGYYRFYKSVKPDSYVVGEVFDADASLVKSYEGGQLDQVFNFELARDFMQSASTGTNIPINSGLTFAAQSIPGGSYATFLTNHDQDRTMSTLGGDLNKARLAAFLLLTSPGTPYIYYGEEIGMRGAKPDEDIRRPMQWDSSPAAGFTTGEAWRPPADDYKTVNAGGEARDDQSLLQLYRHLVATRKAHSALNAGDIALIDTDNSAVYSALRFRGDERILVLANLTGNPVSTYALRLNAPEALPRGDYTLTTLFGEGRFADLKVAADGQLQDYLPMAEIPAYGLYLLSLARR